MDLRRIKKLNEEMRKLIASSSKTRFLKESIDNQDVYDIYENQQYDELINLIDTDDGEATYLMKVDNKYATITDPDMASPLFTTKDEALDYEVKVMLEMDTDDILDTFYQEYFFKDIKESQLLKRKLQKAIGHKLYSLDD